MWLGSLNRTNISKFRCRFEVSIRTNITKTAREGLDISMAHYGDKFGAIKVKYAEISPSRMAGNLRPVL